MQKQKIILIIGVVLALITVFLIKMYLDQQRIAAEQVAKRKYEKASASQTVVLVALRDIPAGSTIDPNSLEKKVMPNEFLQPQAVTSIERISGMITIAPIVKDEQVTLTKLSYQRSGDLAQATPPGKRAVTIAVDNLASLAGMLKPGNYVDVIAMLTIPVQTAEGKTTGQLAALPLFQNVQILAVGQDIGAIVSGAEADRYTKDAKKDSSSGGLITLALNPQEANLMAFIQEQGKIRLLLRSPSDAKVEPMKPASWETLFQYLMPPQPEQVKQPELEPGPQVEIIRGLNKETVPLKK